MHDRRVDAFLAIVDTGTFSAAAARLYVTQPAITQQVKSLESELGVRLFKRSGNRYLLSEAGEVARDYLLRIRGIEEEMTARLVDLIPRSMFVIGCPSVMSIYDNELFSEIMRLAARRFPEREAVSREVPGPPENYRFLSDGDVDVMVSAIEPLERHAESIGFRALGEVAYWLVCSSASPIAKRGIARASDLDGTAVFLFDDMPDRNLIVRSLEKVAHVHPVYQQESSPSSALPRVEAGRGVFFSTIDKGFSGEVALVPFDFEGTLVYNNTGLVWLKRRETPELLGFVDDVEAVVARRRGAGRVSASQVPGD